MGGNSTRQECPCVAELTGSAWFVRRDEAQRGRAGSECSVSRWAVRSPVRVWLPGWGVGKLEGCWTGGGCPVGGGRWSHESGLVVRGVWQDGGDVRMYQYIRRRTVGRWGLWLGGRRTVDDAGEELDFKLVGTSTDERWEGTRTGTRKGGNQSIKRARQARRISLHFSGSKWDDKWIGLVSRGKQVKSLVDCSCQGSRQSGTRSFTVPYLTGRGVITLVPWPRARKEGQASTFGHLTLGTRKQEYWYLTPFSQVLHIKQHQRLGTVRRNLSGQRGAFRQKVESLLVLGTSTFVVCTSYQSGIY